MVYLVVHWVRYERWPKVGRYMDSWKSARQPGQLVRDLDRKGLENQVK